MKILLACSAGTSTSLVVAALEKYWLDQKIEGHQVAALGVAEAAVVAKDYDVVLLGPQVRFQIANAKSWVQGTTIPVDVMNAQDYALARAEKIWNHILKLTK